MEKSLDLTAIAARLCDAENEWLGKIPCRHGSPREITTAAACMPKKTKLSAELKFLNDSEFTLWVGPSGSCDGIYFCMEGMSYKFVGSVDNIVGQQKAFMDMGFKHVPSSVLKERKKKEDRKKPLDIKGAIAYTPQKTTTRLSAYTYLVR